MSEHINYLPLSLALLRKASSEPNSDLSRALFVIAKLVGGLHSVYASVESADISLDMAIKSVELLSKGLSSGVVIDQLQQDASYSLKKIRTNPLLDKALEQKILTLISSDEQK